MFTLFKSKASITHIGVQLLTDTIILVVPAKNGSPPKVIEHTVSSGQHARALKQLVAEHHLAGCRASVVISPQQYRSYLIDRPAVPNDELADAAKWRTQDMLEFNVENAVVDVFEYPEEALRGRSAQINVRVAKSDIIVQLLDVLKSADLEPQSIVTADIALASVLISQEADQSRVSVLLYLHDHYGMLVLVKNGQLYLARDFDFDFASLHDPSRQAGKLDQLTLDIQRSLDYFESQMGLASPSTLSIFAPNTALPLANMIGGALGLTVENFSLSALEANSNKTNLGSLHKAVYAYGSLLVPDNPSYSVNLYSEAFQTKTQALRLSQLLVASAAVLFVCIGIHFYLVAHLDAQQAEYEASQGSIIALQQQVARLSKKQKAMKLDLSIKGRNTELQKNIDAYRALLVELGEPKEHVKFSYSELFRSLATHKPEKLWLTEFDADGSEGRLHINGETYDAAEIPLFLQGLQTETLFSKQAFGSLDLVQHEDDKGRYVFSLKGVSKEGTL